MAKKSNYNPAARDGDDDGLVQDGTSWERPVGELMDDINDEMETLTEQVSEMPLASVETPVEDIKPVERPRTYVVESGDSYASIAKKHKPAGIKSFDYAKDLLEANGGKALRPGIVIIL